MDLDGTSRLSQDLRWGLLSPVEVVDRAEGAGEGRRTFVAEIAWREFYAHVLAHHPRVLREPFKPAFAALPWRDDPDAFEAWRTGRTGYPVVDAAMRQLRATGFVHNRARMIAASFLTKDLLLDWRRARPSSCATSSTATWPPTTAAGSGRPAPARTRSRGSASSTRSSRGSGSIPMAHYVRRWVPELRGIAGAAIHEPWLLDVVAQAAARVRIGTDYPAPIVDHAEARARALAVYGAVGQAASSD